MAVREKGNCTILDQGIYLVKCETCLEVWVFSLSKIDQEAVNKWMEVHSKACRRVGSGKFRYGLFSKVKSRLEVILTV